MGRENYCKQFTTEMVVLRAVICLMMICCYGFSATLEPAHATITNAWFNTGEDKVTQDELRASSGANVTNSAWNGSKVNLFGAKNEVVSFNLVLEAVNTGAQNVTVSFDRLTGPDGTFITSGTALGNGVFNWVGRNIELFYIRYLEIKGLSHLCYNATYDERHVPDRFRRPWTGEGDATGTWEDRPDHNKLYPDIAVPLELVPQFNIAANTNQSIWCDIYIPKTATAGPYHGTITVREDDEETLAHEANCVTPQRTRRNCTVITLILCAHS